jgi:hypothetical protein
MTKFEEMCKAFSDNRNAWIQYRDRCVGYIAALIKGFAVYCDLPQGNLVFLPQGAKGLDDKTYALPSAMYFDSDGYWRADVCITVFEAANVFPHHPVRFGLSLREADGKILVKRGWDPKAREINLSDKGQCDDFYAGIAERIMEVFSRKPQDLALDESRNRSSIGFSLD